MSAIRSCGAHSAASRRTSTPSTTPEVTRPLGPAAAPGSADLAGTSPRALGARRRPPRAASPPAGAAPPGIGGSLTVPPSTAASSRATPLWHSRSGRVADAVPGADPQIVLDVPAHRPDLLSHKGVAREPAAPLAAAAPAPAIPRGRTAPGRA